MFKVQDPFFMTKSPPLNPKAEVFKAAEQSQEGGIGNAESEDASTEQVARESEYLDAPVDPAMVPLPESDSDDLDSPDAHSAIREAIQLEIPELANQSTEVSPQWSSPTWSDEGVTALVWVSPIIAEYERWMFVKANLKTMELIPRSPFVPRTFSEWLIHRAEMTDIKVSPIIEQTSACHMFAIRVLTSTLIAGQGAW